MSHIALPTRRAVWVGLSGRDHVPVLIVRRCKAYVKVRTIATGAVWDCHPDDLRAVAA